MVNNMDGTCPIMTGLLVPRGFGASSGEADKRTRGV